MQGSEVQRFQKHIQRFFAEYGRHDLPWRQNYDPYRILVSEIMLQQTQVDRVIPKFLSFLDQFPNFQSLATAPVSEVIRAWQGLGYNRRGLNLQRAAQHVVRDFNGHLPKSEEDLLNLPGIGPYTAAAIRAFAFNQPSIVIETNIRTVFIYHFFPTQDQVADQELLPLLELTLDRENPRQWYSALMDYGTYLKQVLPNPTRKSKLYSKQSKLEGSNRQVRGLILKALTQESTLTPTELSYRLAMSNSRIEPALHQLLKEGFVEYQADTLRLKS